MSEYRSGKLPFKPRARLLLLLGDQLIRDSGIAVFELVKNAYDADASKAIVTMYDVSDSQDARIVVKDNGSGMDWGTVTNIWLEPGTDHRNLQRIAGKRTEKHGRFPMGEKGVGRFAAHKLGSQVTLVTRKKNNLEVVVEIDWRDFEKGTYLDDIKVSIREREPKVFPRPRTGTQIEIRRLRDTWTRGMVRDLYRAIMSICSPFESPSDFETALVLHPQNGWLDGLLKPSEVLDFALFKASCSLQGTELQYDYSFQPLPGMNRLQGRKVAKKHVSLSRIVLTESGKKKVERIDLNEKKIGPIEIDLYVFDREPAVLEFSVNDKKGLKEFLDANGGIRVYRDNVRVYDYGQPENDWLDLGGRRVNLPTKRVSNNLVIGAVSLSLERSQDLIEKTNREGFIENRAYQLFRDAVLFAVTQIEQERKIDKLRIRSAYHKGRKKEPVLEDLALLREKIEKHGLEEELGRYLDNVEKQFIEVRDRLLTAAGAGLSLAVVIHEVEKGIEELNKAVSRNVPMDSIRELARSLSELVEGLTYLTRKSGTTKEKASVLIRHALFNTEYRTNYHKIRVINGMEQGDPDFSVKCTRRLIIATLMNLIDNSIWWLDNKGAKDKRIYIGTTQDLKNGPAIIVADNGPGFLDPPEYLVQPFMSRKPDGMGLGLHLASEVMKAHNGRLEFPEAGDVSLPTEFDGAVVALLFGGE